MALLFLFLSPNQDNILAGLSFCPQERVLPLIHIRNLSDRHLLTHDPDLQWEVISYMLYCRYELQEYADDDINFKVLSVFQNTATYDWD